MASIASAVKFERHALGRQQRHVLLDQRRLGLGQDAAEVVAGERRSSTRIGSRPCSSGSRSDGFDRCGNAPDAMNRMWSVFTAPCLVETVVPSISGRRSRCTPSRDTSAPTPLAAGDLVDLVEEDDAVLLDRLDRFLHQLVVVEQLVGFLVDQDVVRFRDRDAARLGAAAAELAEDVADRDGAHLRARHAGDLEQRHAAAGRLHLDLDLLVVELAGAQLPAEGLLGGGAGVLADQRVEHALLGRELARACTSLRFFSRVMRDRDLDEIAHDLLDVAADIADLGELGRLDLEERRAGELGEAAGNLGLADAGRADHQDVLGQHLLAQLVVELQPPPAVAQRDRDRALGVALTDDEAVELGDDLRAAENRSCDRL